MPLENFVRESSEFDLLILNFFLVFDFGDFFLTWVPITLSLSIGSLSSSEWDEVDSLSISLRDVFGFGWMESTGTVLSVSEELEGPFTCQWWLYVGLLRGQVGSKLNIFYPAVFGVKGAEITQKNLQAFFGFVIFMRKKTEKMETRFFSQK